MSATHDCIDHKHGINCGHGLRVVPVSTEILSMFLKGDCRDAIPENVPRDMQVVGSLTKQDLMRTIGTLYPPLTVMLLCVSEEWDITQDFDRNTNEVRLFEPQYRTKGVV